MIDDVETRGEARRVRFPTDAVVEADDEMVSGPSHRDVEEP